MKALLKNKKFIIILSIVVLLISLTIVGILYFASEKNDSKIIPELALQEGCYENSNNSNHLWCFTKEAKHYDILYKYDTYYNDIYYNVAPPTEDSKMKKDFKVENEVITIQHFNSNGELFNSYVCGSTDAKTIKCNNTVVLLEETTTNEVIYTKIEKEFTTETIKSLPIYERNKVYKIILDGENIECNFTHNYSILETASSYDISKCLEKKYGEKYHIAQLENNDNWQIYSNSVSKSVYDKYGNTNGLNYVKANYSYTVTVDNKSFKYTKAFPVDPYATDEVMTVVINKANVKIDTKETYKSIAGNCYWVHHINNVTWRTFNICFDDKLDKAYTWTEDLGDYSRKYNSHNLTDDNGILKYGNVEVIIKGTKVKLQGQKELTREVDKELIQSTYFKNSCGLQEWLGSGC